MERKEYIYTLLSTLAKHLSVDISKISLLQSIDQQNINELSLDVISKILLDFNVSNRCYHISIKDMDNRYTPFLILTKSKEDPFVIVNNIEDGYIEYYSSIKGVVREQKENIVSFFSEYILIPITDESSGDIQFSEHTNYLKKKKVYKSIIWALCAMSSLSILFSFFYLQTSHFVELFLLFILKLLGLGTVFTIIAVELNKENYISRKVCKNSGCNKVIHSKIGKLLKYLTLGDIGLIYFLSSLLCILLSICIVDINKLLYILFLINILTLPFSLFSVLYQKIKVKEWCPLCLTIMGIFWLEFLIYSCFLPLSSFTLEARYVIYVILIHALTLIGWLVLKKPIEQSVKLEACEKTIRIFKSKDFVLKGMMSEHDSLPLLTTKYSLSIGNNNSPEQFIVVAKFGCPACLSVIKEALDICRINPDLLHIAIVFRNIQNDLTIEVLIKKIIAYVRSKGKRGVEINDSFWNKLSQSKEALEEFLLNLDLKVDEEIDIIYTQQLKWIESIKTSSTPAIIYNGKELPLLYEFRDIVKIINRSYYEQSL